jgi:hypothetical protein
MPPTYTTTALNALRWLTGTNAVNDIDAGFQALAEDVDAKLGSRGYAQVNTLESTSAGAGGADLATVGPSVTLTVPTNGLVAVFAAVDIDGSGSASGADIYLLEDGAAIDLSVPIIHTDTSSTQTWYTSVDVTAPAGSCGTNSRVVAGWLTFPASAGSHTYKLRYATNGGSSSFSDRRLWVRALSV